MPWTRSNGTTADDRPRPANECIRSTPACLLMRLSIVDGDGGRASNARKIRTGARPILRTSHFSLEKIFLEKKMEDFRPLPFPLFFQRKSAIQKRGRRDDSIDDKGELFFRPYDRYPRCSFQARVDNKFKFRGARNL